MTEIICRANGNWDVLSRCDGMKLLILEIIMKNIMMNTYKTIYRRFSDLERLHEGLLNYNPGCRIHLMPEKSIWTNLNVNSNKILEKRRKQIEEYLNYINKQ